jgi:Transposase.
MIQLLEDVYERETFLDESAERKPFVSEKNRKARLKFAKNHLHWTSAEWSKVLWNDESKFCLFGSDGRKYVRRPIGMRHNHKYQLSTENTVVGMLWYGGASRVMVWGL